MLRILTVIRNFLHFFRVNPDDEQACTVVRAIGEMLNAVDWSRARDGRLLIVIDRYLDLLRETMLLISGDIERCRAMTAAAEFLERALTEGDSVGERVAQIIRFMTLAERSLRASQTTPQLLNSLLSFMSRAMKRMDKPISMEAMLVFRQVRRGIERRVSSVGGEEATGAWRMVMQMQLEQYGQLEMAATAANHTYGDDSMGSEREILEEWIQSARRDLMEGRGSQTATLASNIVEALASAARSGRGLVRTGGRGPGGRQRFSRALNEKNPELFRRFVAALTNLLGAPELVDDAIGQYDNMTKPIEYGDFSSIVPDLAAQIKEAVPQYFDGYQPPPSTGGEEQVSSSGGTWGRTGGGGSNSLGGGGGRFAKKGRGERPSNSDRTRNSKDGIDTPAPPEPRVWLAVAGPFLFMMVEQKKDQKRPDGAEKQEDGEEVEDEGDGEEKECSDHHVKVLRVFDKVI